MEAEGGDFASKVNVGAIVKENRERERGRGREREIEGGERPKCLSLQGFWGVT